MSTATPLAMDRPAAPVRSAQTRAPRWRLRVSADSAARIELVVQNLVRLHGIEPARCQRYVDPATGWHHSRHELDAARATVTTLELRRSLVPIAARARAQAHVAAAHEPQRIAVLVSKADHCLRELFAQQSEGLVPVEIACVISNHEDLGPLALAHGVPFHHVPMPPAPDHSARTAAFDRVFELFGGHQAEVMVLARFMQILPAAFCTRAAGRILNVHHSLLPAFTGARPYHQAWRQGVKWIGATCHYVTAELDQGPIIAQEARRVDHTHSIDDLIRAGRNLECRVLEAGLRAHVEGRVIVCGQRTVVFDA